MTALSIICKVLQKKYPELILYWSYHDHIIVSERRFQNYILTIYHDQVELLDDVTNFRILIDDPEYFEKLDRIIKYYVN